MEPGRYAGGPDLNAPLITDRPDFTESTVTVGQGIAPTGSEAFTDAGWQPGINWTYGWQINNFLSTAGSTQINRRFEDSGDDFLRLTQSWTVAFSLSEKVGAYTEWFALFPMDSGRAENEHYINGGLTYLINNDLQFDVRVGWGLNEAAEDFFAGAGLSVRFQ